MAYRLPNFNLLCNAWACNQTPTNDPPTWEDVPCQLYVVSRPNVSVTPSYTNDYYVEWNFPIVIRGPRTEQPFDSYANQMGAGIWEVPVGSGNYYRTLMSEVVHMGFPNEYMAVVVTQCDYDGKMVTPAGSAIATGFGQGPCN